MFKIAIDGPAGAGKSTIAKRIATELGIEYIDTGAMYRAITLKILRLGLDMEDEKSYEFLSKTVLDIENGKVFLDGVDVSKEIRSVEVTENVSVPSRIGVVREYLVDYQRKISKSKSVIMDGRDIGTVVLPNAELKIYLDASVECRAKRRMLERMESGVVKSLEDTMEEIAARDYKDSTRKISPLKCAEDAVVVDSSNMTIEEVVTTIKNLVNERGLIKMSEKQFTVGQTVQGMVTGVSETAIYLEIEEGVKAVIYVQDILDHAGENFKELYTEGSDFSAQVKSIGKDKYNPGVVLLTLSQRLALDEKEKEERKKALDAKFARIHECKDNDEIILAKVGKSSQNGVELFYNNTKLFLSYKQTNLKQEDFKKLYNQEIPVIVCYIDDEKHSVAVTHSAAVRKQKRIDKENAYASVKVGDCVEAEAVSLMEYGAILKFGPVTGLLHISEVDHLPVKEITKYIQIGKKYNVKVIKVDGQKISLSLKALSQHPWDKLKEIYHVGDVKELKVLKLIPAGIILELTPEYSGLMPKVEWSWNVTDKYEGKIAEGETLSVKIMSFDDSKKRVSLSHRALEANSWSDIKLHRGEIIEVTIKAIADRGATVEYQNVEGFLPVGETDSEKHVSSVADLYPVGTVVSAMVQDFDQGRQKLSVSIKAIQTQKERETFEKYLDEQDKEAAPQTLGDLIDLSEFEEKPAKKKASSKK